jgi:hypothetical protein
MPKICYVEKRFQANSLKTIQFCNAIIADYQRQGFTLTLRQLYYQCVSRNFIPNTQKAYDSLGAVISDARLAGLIDWEAIEDRTRYVRSLAHWDDPSDIVAGAAQQYRVDLWEGQTYRPEVWIEKDSLVGVFEGVCEEFDVPLFSCRGYTSQSEMWNASQRILRTRRHRKQLPMILHFGDHDPSGMDMSRDIIDRITLFTGGIELKRLALNMDQIDQYNPPPNPAKLSDSRAQGYIAEFGNESWELDALSPTALAALVRENIEALIDEEPWDERKALVKEGREHLQTVSDKWDDIKTLIDEDRL